MAEMFVGFLVVLVIWSVIYIPETRWIVVVTTPMIILTTPVTLNIEFLPGLMLAIVYWCFKGYFLYSIYPMLVEMGLFEEG